MDTICKSALGADFGIQKHGPNHPLVVTAKALFDTHSNIIFTVIGESPHRGEVTRIFISAELDLESVGCGSVRFSIRKVEATACR